MPDGEFSEQFEQLSGAGHAAKDAGNHALASRTFREADDLAQAAGSDLKRMHALVPEARGLWSQGLYDEAAQTLSEAAVVADRLDLVDEQAITVSAFGRLAAVKTVRTVPVNQAETLRAEALPKFQQAYDMLRGHPHRYYRYANAQHGSVVSALAGDRWLAGKLVFEGALAAFRQSPYDTKASWRINPGGLGQLAAAVALLPLGGRTPYLAPFARRKLVR
jgi:tetratricopeptide (TPR) repeat protein